MFGDLNIMLVFCTEQIVYVLDGGKQSHQHINNAKLKAAFAQYKFVDSITNMQLLLSEAMTG